MISQIRAIPGREPSGRRRATAQAGWAQLAEAAGNRLQAASSRRVLCTWTTPTPHCAKSPPPLLSRAGGGSGSRPLPPSVYRRRRRAARAVDDRRARADRRDRRRRDRRAAAAIRGPGLASIAYFGQIKTLAGSGPTLVCDHRARRRERRHHAHDRLHAVHPDRRIPASRDRAHVRRRPGPVHAAGAARARARARSRDLLRGRGGRAVLPRLDQSRSSRAAIRSATTPRTTARCRHSPASSSSSSCSRNRRRSASTAHRSRACSGRPTGSGTRPRCRC